MQRNDPPLTLQVLFLPQTSLHCLKGYGKTFKLEKVKSSPPRRRCSGVPLALRTPLHLFPPARRTSLRLYPWSSPQCNQRDRVWTVWIVMPRWPLVISAKPWTVTVVGKTWKVNKNCSQHLNLTVMIGRISSRTVFEDFMGWTPRVEYRCVYWSVDGRSPSSGLFSAFNHSYFYWFWDIVSPTAWITLSEKTVIGVELHRLGLKFNFGQVEVQRGEAELNFNLTKIELEWSCTRWSTTDSDQVHRGQVEV